MSNVEIDKLKLRIMSIECDLGMVVEQGMLFGSVLVEVVERLEELTKRGDLGPVYSEIYRIKNQVRLVQQGVAQMWIDADTSLNDSEG